MALATCIPKHFFSNVLFVGQVLVQVLQGLLALATLAGAYSYIVAAAAGTIAFCAIAAAARAAPLAAHSTLWALVKCMVVARHTWWLLRVIFGAVNYLLLTAASLLVTALQPQHGLLQVLVGCLAGLLLASFLLGLVLVGRDKLLEIAEEQGWDIPQGWRWPRDSTPTHRRQRQGGNHDQPRRHRTHGRLHQNNRNRNRNRHRYPTPPTY
jgi:hypothetical protein